MLPHPLESLARERWQALFQEAEKHRLLKRAAIQQADRHTMAWLLRYRLGAWLVKWGYQLQGYRRLALSQLPKGELCQDECRVGELCSSST